MKKLLPLLVLALFSHLPLQAQLPDGIVAPNFTATDINGNSWTLYDLLDQGKSVVLFFGTTWSYNSWEYQQAGRLTQVWEQYGPNGTNEVIPFFIEIDNGTDAEDLNGTGDATYGDWVTGTPYPIFDDAEGLGELYAQDDVPNVYAICPNRILNNAIDYPTVQFQLNHADCLLPSGVNNAGMLRFVEAPKEFCGAVNFSPNVRFQNLGTAPLTNLTLHLLLNGSVVETRTWMGNLNLYQTAGIIFNAVNLTNSADVAINITAVNGLPDDDTSNDAISTTVAEGPSIATNYLVVEIKTDYYPREIYWEVLDDEGTVFHAGGNPGIFDGEEWEGAYTDQETVYQHEVALPSDGCYEFVIYDQYDDGICCDEGFGYYRLQDENNFIYLQGGLFDVAEHRPFELVGTSTIQHNAAIRGYDGLSGDICEVTTFVPSLVVQNLGANSINSLKINVLNESTLVQTFSWNGVLPAGFSDTIALEPVTVDATSDWVFEIAEVNQHPDTFFFQNKTQERIFRRQPETPGLVLEFVTDQWGYENYWQITNAAGDLIASGSNQNIGPDGGGLQVAQATDPGAYPQFSMITEQISLPADVNDCYTFLFVDDWGDGINAPGYIKMTDNLGNVLFDFRPRTTGDTYLIDGQFGPSATSETASGASLTLSPNPASDHLEVAFSTAGNDRPLCFEIVDVTGKVLQNAFLPTSTQRHSFDLAALHSGVYFLKMVDEKGGETVRRFVVAAK